MFSKLVLLSALAAASGVQEDHAACTREQKLLKKHVDRFIPFIDDNKDSLMSLGELYHHLAGVMREHHHGFADHMRLGFAPADTDISGALSKSEYLAAELSAAEAAQYGWATTDDQHRSSLHAHGANMFMLLDADGNGELSMDEHIRRTGIDADIMQLLHVADTDNDGKISRAEILRSAGRIPAHLETFLSMCQG